MAEESEKALL